MGVDIHVHICKYNADDNFYHELSLYRLRNKDEKYNYCDEEGNPVSVKDKYERISPYNGRDYEMFEGMRGKNEYSGYGYFPSCSIALNSIEPTFREEIIEKKGNASYYNFQEISFSDFVNYLHDHPTVVDYDSDKWDDLETTDPRPQKENPLKGLFDSCLIYVNFAEKFGIMNEPYSKYKILYWFDN